MADFWKNVKTDTEVHTHKKPSMFQVLKSIWLHPAVRVLFRYRLMTALPEKNILARFIRRWLWSANCMKSGCFLSPYCTIEPGVILVHPTGVVIGEGAVIKSGARIFQNVTVGTKNWKENKTAAIIEEGATLYAGAVIAGSWQVGKNASVGANAVVLSHIPIDQVYVGVPASAVKKA